MKQNSLNIYIEISGIRTLAGRISPSPHGGYQFFYDHAYLDQAGATPLSVSLPLQEDPFTAEITKNFFDGCLPEGFTRQSVAQRMHRDAADYLSILLGLGEECLGAIQVLPEGDDGAFEPPSYQELSPDDVRALAGEGASFSADLITQAHLSLTGASGKVGLYYDHENGKWYLPRGTAPSTHIVKQSHVRLEQIVLNEQLSQMTASGLGIETPHSFIINTGRGRDEDILLATERYDREFSSDPRKISGLPMPLRLHQEDLAQAMGIASKDKYETEDRGEQGYLPRMFDLIRSVCRDPLEDQMKLWDRVIFCWLLGNTDSHIKNFSLLYTHDLHAVSLAPAYDMVSTAVYGSGSRDMAFYIADDIHLDAIRRKSFRAAALRCGLGARLAMRRFDALCENFPAALENASAALTAEGFPDASRMKQEILECGGYRFV